MPAQGLTHGMSELPAVTVDSYNELLSDRAGPIGDRANKRAFRDILDECRETLRERGEDPLGDLPSDSIPKGELDRLLQEGEPEAAALIQRAIEEFSDALAGVVRRYLRLKAWRGTERIVVGGGFRGSRIGELAIGRASLALKADGLDINLQPICHDPQEAGLIGAVHLAPAWVFEGYDSLLAVDIGGTNIRAGILDLKRRKPRDLSKVEVWRRERWRHAEEKPKPKREEAVDKLADMLSDLVAEAQEKRRKLAPFIGVGCPGIIAEDGAIVEGGQNLPGNWESSRFNLAERLCAAIPTIGEHDTTVLLHNDAVVQGLSEVPFVRDCRHWAVLTIGTGLGNARFTNNSAADEG